MSDPTGFTSGKELVNRKSIVKGEDPEEITGSPDAVFLELWEGTRSMDGVRHWAIAIMNDWRPKSARESVHIPIGDDEAGYLKRHYTEVVDA